MSIIIDVLFFGRMSKRQAIIMFSFFGRMSIKTSDKCFVLWKDVYKDKRQAMFFFIGRMSKKTTIIMFCSLEGCP